MAYSTIKDTIITGGTGRELRKHPAEVRELQFYLCVAPEVDRLGIFIFEPDLAANRLGRTEKKVIEATRVLRDLGFCQWDDDSQYIWIVEMAHHQFQLPVKATDKRCAGARRWYETLPRNPHMGPWFDRYAEAFHFLEGPEPVERREWGERTPPPEGPSGQPEGPCTVVSVPAEDFVLLPPEVRTTGLVVASQNGTLAGSALEAAFDRLWKLYPKATERKEARAQFGRLKPTGELVAKMEAAILAQRDSVDWTKENRRYVPRFTKWIERGRWDDRVEPRGPVVSDRTANSARAIQGFLDRRRGQR